MRKCAMMLLAVAALFSLSIAGEPIYYAGDLLSAAQSPGNPMERDENIPRLDECNIPCPPGAITDGEVTCLTGLNEGCNTAPVSATPIECNMSVCGTVFTYDGTDGSSNRDTDFFRLVLTQQTRVTWVVYAGFPAAAAIAGIHNVCSSVPIYDYVSGAACETITASACLDAGEYWLFVSTAGIFSGIPCQAYAATVTCSPCADPCEGTESVTFQPGTAGKQFECVDLCLNQLLPIYVCPGGTAFPPRVVVVPGCFHQRPGCDVECPPAEFYYNPNNWTIDPATGCWVNYVRPLSNGCACVGFDGFLAVQLLSFAATPASDRVTLAWQTASETDNDHFEVLRDNAKIADIAAQGGVSGFEYRYLDRNVEQGRVYQYDLIAVDAAGNREVLGSESVTLLAEPTVVSEYTLHQNYPNPFNPTTKIRFDMVESGFVTLKVYNATGQEIATLVNGNVNAGATTMEFDASGLTAGVYFYRLETSGFSAVQKMLLLK